ncbi:MAG: GNAT family N-acetyltransferase [Verrucomicrobiaceae bacterium]|nr:MAG: GNAT family N-acetyltransferase [Verrucomicrobiaceae bacterium]
MIEIAHATPDDCRHIADIQVRGWQAAYRGIIPDDFLDRLDPAGRVGVWRMFVESRKGKMLISRRGPDINGFCHLIPSRDEDSDGIAEIAAIYIDPDHLRHGYGRQLCEKAFTLAARQGYRSLTLWVLTENRRGRAFYEAMGMLPDGATKEVDRPGFTLRETRYRIDLPPPHPPRRAI